MKKFIFCICSLMIFLTSSALVYAAELTEMSSIKIVIDGKQGSYSNLPLLINGRTLLPLREVLTNIGVSNDDQHIIWNFDEKSVTVYKGSKKVYLKINSNIAYVNDEQVILDVAPIIYKNRTYIPVRFISQSIGKKVQWDGDTNTVFIYEEGNYDNISSVIDTTNKAMSVSKYKVKSLLNIYNKTDTMKVTTTQQGEKDEKKKIFHSMIKTLIINNEESNEKLLETYNENNQGFIKIDGNWSKNSLPELSTDEIFQKIKYGLLIVSKPEESIIVLEGDVGFISMVFKNDSTYKTHSIIKIDKNTNRIIEFKMNITGSDSNGLPYIYDMITTCYDYNGDFEVTKPSDLTIDI